MNSNYIRGRAFEYKRMKEWREWGYTCMRTAGSHGFADIIAVKAGRPVEFIQCKVTKSEAAGQLLLRSFKKDPPFPPDARFHQVLEVWVSSIRELFTVTV